jgi:iron(III) transport system permease protein
MSRKRTPRHSSLVTRHLRAGDRAFTLLTLAAFGLLVLPPLLWLLVAAAESLLVTRHSSLVTLSQARAWRLLARSVGVAAGSATLATVLGTPYGLLLARARLPASRLWAALGVLPMLLPPYAAAIAWLIFLGQAGPLHEWLARRGYVGLAFFSPTGVAMTCATNGLLYWPIAAGFAALALRAVPAELEETARLEANPWRALWIAARPALGAALGAAGLLVFLLALADFGVPSTFNLAVFPVELFAQFSGDYNTGAAVRLALPLLLVALPLAVAQHRGFRELPTLAEAGACPPLPLGRWRGLAVAYCFMLVALSACVPLGVLIAEAGPVANYLRVAQESGIAAWVSFWTAAVAAAAVAGVALPLALLAERRFGRLSAPAAGSLSALATVGYALPGVLIAVALIGLLNRPGPLGALYDSSLVLPIAYVVRFFPFAFQAIAPACRRLSPALLEAAALDGAGPLARLRRIALPASRGAAATGAALVFLLSARELDATLLVRPPGADTLALRIYDLFHYGPSGQVGALCVIAVALSALALTPLLALRGRE